jgi:hypothetical protein
MQRGKRRRKGRPCIACLQALLELPPSQAASLLAHSSRSTVCNLQEGSLVDALDGHHQPCTIIITQSSLLSALAALARLVCPCCSDGHVAAPQPSEGRESMTAVGILDSSAAESLHQDHVLAHPENGIGAAAGPGSQLTSTAPLVLITSGGAGMWLHQQDAWSLATGHTATAGSSDGHPASAIALNSQGGGGECTCSHQGTIACASGWARCDEWEHAFTKRVSVIRVESGSSGRVCWVHSARRAPQVFDICCLLSSCVLGATTVV